ncbi:ribonuclease III domain-containing protein [Mortierella sp. GBAus27b]|nr:hypothetical protein BGX31_001826 [Mortierella sp. GBA43]KAI8352947.1 ribonuclease III domain-containing protein [Mortierella sp. GBAus27b]
MRIGYRFRNQRLLAEAIKIQSPNSEGLEFVGDAALELANARYWSACHPRLERSRRFSLKDASGLDHHLVRGPSVNRKILAAIQSHNRAMVDPPSWDFWMEINYPKNLADAVEALFGAVYVDSGFSDHAVYAMFETLMGPYLTGYILPNTIRMSPENDLKSLWLHILGVSSCRARIACRKVFERVKKDRTALTALCGCFKR